MKSNIVRMTLTNECIHIYKDAIWIQPVNSDGFKFSGLLADLINILVYHQDIDLTHCEIRVRDRNIDFYVSPSVDGY